ncbi:hypothetical protein LIER_16285 [Lithospermum erythrorhizon]|uniref:DUF4283 domain-containing protein n=1 Tax=Lithospermum erythrorhizon TaxID=34254 RepID=A0AAV3Q624_LITER
MAAPPLGEGGERREKGSWVEVVKRNPPKNRLNLTYIPPNAVDGREVVRYCSNDVMIGVNRWKSKVFGFFLRLNPSFGVIENFAKNHWKQFGFESAFKLNNGVFLFQFESDKKRDEMMEEGPWSLARRPLILEKKVSESVLEKKGVKFVPVWVRIPNLSLQFWNPEMLSKIGSPLFADSTTSSLERLAYARVCVEVTAEKELPKSVPLLDEADREF